MEYKGRNDDHKRVLIPKNPERQYAYFRDDQIVLLVTHKEKMISGDHLKSLSTELSLHLKAIKEDAILLASEQQVDSFQRLAYGIDDNQDTMLSVITFNVQNAPGDPLYLAELNNNFNQKNRGSTIDGLTLQGSSPNWLTSIASQGGGTGGPGGRPLPFNGSRQGAPAHFDSLINRLKAENIYDAGAGVDVAILDTAPTAHALVAAPKEWPDHPLISTLLGPKGKLILYPAPYDEVVRLGNTSLNDHDYNMTDHGLFVAGIVHSIVPEAKIHLVEVLNQYGVGDLTSFVRGLRTVLNQIYKPERKLVINCSWMLEFPRDQLHCHHRNETDPDAEFERQVLQFSSYDQATAAMLQFLFNEFSSLGRQAIAAAGNDGRDGAASNIPARYPAALENVIGVGALPKTMRTTIQGQYERSIYSNLADEPESKGVATLGGEAGDEKGVLGIYIGEFPVELNPSLWRRILNWFITLLGGRVAGPANITKWAWWAGTSFATPILTGAVAAVLSSPPQSATTQGAIQKLYSSGIIKDRARTGLLSDSTEAGEDVLEVVQN